MKPLRVFPLLMSLMALAWPTAASATPGLVILTYSHTPGIQRKAETVKRYLSTLRKANHLDDLEFPIVVVDLADPIQASLWRASFGVGRDELPAVACVDMNGNKVITVAAVVRKFADPIQAASQVYAFEHKRDPNFKVTRVSTGFAVSSVPDGATVYVDGKESGTTPVTVEAPPGRRVRVEVKSPDAEDWSGFYSAKPGVVTPVKASLKLLDGVVEFAAPKGAEVFVDGNEAAAGTIPFRLPGPAGAHSVVCKASGYNDASFEFRISAKKLTTVSVGLLPKGSVRVAIKSSFNEFASADGSEISVPVNNAEVENYLGSLLSKDPRVKLVTGDAPYDLGIEVLGNVTNQTLKTTVNGTVTIYDNADKKLDVFGFDKAVNLLSNFLSFNGNAGAAGTKSLKDAVGKVAPDILKGLPTYAEKLPPPPAPEPTVKVSDL